MKCFKFIVIALNVCYLVLSLILVSVAASPRFIFGDYFSILATYNHFGSLTLIWIGSGFALMGLTIFGISGALKESTMMINLYIILLSLVLILHIVAATTCILLSDKLNEMVQHSVKTLMDEYRSNNNPDYYLMNWIQNQYKCCGNNRPSDWYDQYESTEKTRTSTTTTEATVIWEDLTPPDIQYNNRMKNDLTLPFSCCKSKCEGYYTTGCFRPLYEDLSRIVILVGSISSILCLAQIFGIISAYVLLRKISQYKNNRVV